MTGDIYEGTIRPQELYVPTGSANNHDYTGNIILSQGNLLIYDGSNWKIISTL